MHKDPIVEEVRQARAAHAKRFGYDLEKIVQDLKRIEKESGHEVVRFEPKRCEGSKIVDNPDPHRNPY